VADSHEFLLKRFFLRDCGVELVDGFLEMVLIHELAQYLLCLCRLGRYRGLGLLVSSVFLSYFSDLLIVEFLHRVDLGLVVLS